MANGVYSFSSFCSSDRNADLGTELAEEGQCCDLLAWFDRQFSDLDQEVIVKVLEVAAFGFSFGGE